ncbi:MAG: methyl-accepting chemotaxis protein [Ottowia sp.]|nr:methyl-accepting chemotaxis protein [Ottowia sp.]
MQHTFLLTPGIWILRRLRLGGKLALLAGFGCLSLVVAALLLARPQPSAAAVWTWCALAIGVMLYLALALWANVSGVLRWLDQTMDHAAAGDLRRLSGLDGRDELTGIGRELDRMLLTLSAMVANIRSNAALVAQAGRNLTSNNLELATRSEEQASSLAQTGASVAQLSEAVTGNAQAAAAAAARIKDLLQAADTGAQVMEHAVQAIDQIQQDANRMGEIIGTIDSIAFQTNILALNAAVEAARAGEQGRGFAVVASEVRALAGRSAEAARQIRDLISGAVQQVESSVEQIRSAGAGFASVVEGVHSVAGNVGEIADSASSQSAGLAEIDSAVRQLDEITHDNATMAGNALLQTRALEERAGTLAEAVRAFRLQQGTADEAVALVQQAVSLHRSCPDRSNYLQTLSDPAQPYHDRDMYVFALDGNGTYLAFGGNPAKVGTRVQDVAGVDGNGLLHDIVTQAEQGPGWVEYEFTNPATNAVQHKMSFVQRVADLYVGCGVYKTLTAAQPQ